MSRNIVSLVTVVRNCCGQVDTILVQLATALASSAQVHGIDHELIVVDNGSTDDTFCVIESTISGVDQVRAIALVSGGDPDPAYLAGMEAALGDHVILFDAASDSVDAFPAMLEQAMAGADIVLAMRPIHRRFRGRAYDMLSALFVHLYRAVLKVDLRNEAGNFRLVSRRVVTYLTGHENAAAAHRALPSLGGFKTRTVAFDAPPMADLPGTESLFGGVHRAMGLVTATSKTPLRLAMLLCSVAATLSLVYSVYVALVYLFRTDVAAGWTTMSLQMSFMFFLISVAIALLSEYVMQISSSSYRKPPYLVAREARSAIMSREQRLNVVHPD